VTLAYGFTSLGSTVRYVPSISPSDASVSVPLPILSPEKSRNTYRATKVMPQAHIHIPMPRHATAMQHAHHLLRSDPSLPSSQAFDRSDRYKQRCQLAATARTDGQTRRRSRATQTVDTQGLAGPRIAHRQLIYTTAVAVAVRRRSAFAA
jgi:hypothetical protein